MHKIRRWNNERSSTIALLMMSSALPHVRQAVLSHIADFSRRCYQNVRLLVVIRRRDQEDQWMEWNAERRNWQSGATSTEGVAVQADFKRHVGFNNGLDSQCLLLPGNAFRALPPIQLLDRIVRANDDELFHWIVFKNMMVLPDERLRTLGRIFHNYPGNNELSVFMNPLGSITVAKRQLFRPSIVVATISEDQFLSFFDKATTNKKKLPRYEYDDQYERQQRNKPHQRQLGLGQ